MQKSFRGYIVLWAKNNPIEINLKRLRVDLTKANGPLAMIAEESAALTTQYLVSIQGLINLGGGSRLRRGIKKAYRVEWPTKVTFGDADLLDKYVGRYTISPDNPRNRTYKYNLEDGVFKSKSYWPFVFFGWGMRGGKKKKYSLVAFYHDPDTGETIATSPYNPIITSKEVTPFKVIRHPGARARNIYLAYEDRTKKFFSKTFKQKVTAYLAKNGIK